MTAWSTPVSIRARLRKKWDTGAPLAQRARGEAFTPIDLPLRGPTASELGPRYAEVSAWVRQWADQRGPAQLITKTLGGRRIGANAIPDRFRIETFEDLCCFLGTTAEARRHRELVELTDAMSPRLRSWVVDKPLRALAHQEHFERLLACVGWLVDNAGRGYYLRQIDVPGVDTKFIENHRAILAELVDLVTGRPPVTDGRDFAGRYGFRTKPARVRIRFLDPAVSPFPPGITDVELCAEELASLPLRVQRVFVAENEVSCLAFPAVARALLIFGGGYAVHRVSRVSWLHEVPLYYWGDIDTHGFAILDRLRAGFPSAQSMLMDRATLLAHETQWDREPAPVNTDLVHLSADEAALYRDLVEDTFGAAVRLEQEHIAYPMLEAAVSAAASV
ncbi:Wadjet anti-phage system protein JetD domain-containing protein [Mycobacterium sp.]|uniref:Wadjet anti-phage system protein JetD domain-containing protein n=1 Tax=Mycobacterium sp. TaxID=1785 RepID=UPI0025F8D66B|nr:Wadjet anti-phage system protein JetD domain-containing protein [Mycobacterium sp.]